MQLTTIVHGTSFIFIIAIMGGDKIRDLKVWSRKRHIVEEKVYYMFGNIVNKVSQDTV